MKRIDIDLRTSTRTRALDRAALAGATGGAGDLIGAVKQWLSNFKNSVRDVDQAQEETTDGEQK